MAGIRFEKAQRWYPGADVPAVPGIDLEIKDGEFMVLVGPSGCGKSTTLRMLAGLEHVTSGQIRIGSEVVNDLPPKDRDIAMVFQNYALYPHMTVEDNMGFALKLKNVAKPEMTSKVARAASILGLDRLMDRYPRQLSGGQRQRVAMGRALVRDPQVFLFDEPLSNLDAKLRVQMRAEIKELHQRVGTTTIYVTHDQVEAMTMADKIVVLHDGVIEQIGAPLDLYDHPENLFVAGFIGSPAMNFLAGRVVEGAFRTTHGLALPLPAGTDTARLSGRELVYGIRPEHIRATETGGIEGRAVLVEGTGSEIYARLDCHGETLACLFRERLALAHGDAIHVAIDPASVHLFDSSDGKRI